MSPNDDGIDILTEREIDDLSGQESVELSEVSLALRDDAFLALPPERQQAFVTQVRQEEEQLRGQTRAFSEILLEHLDTVRKDSETARNSEDFVKRMELNRRRADAQVNVSFDEKGTVDRGAGDGYAHMGLTHGWTSQAIAQVSAHIYQRIFESSKRPYVLRGGENRFLVKVLYACIDDLLKRGDFKRYAQQWVDGIPTMGTSVLRYQMGSKQVFARDEKGLFRESAPKMVPAFEPWALEDVIVTNLRDKEAWKQEGVFWRTLDVTLPQLEKDEAVFEIDPETGMPIAVAGKFRNLERLREMEASAVVQGNAESGRKTSSFAKGTLYEYEGALPLYSWFRHTDSTHLSFDIMMRLLGHDPIGMDLDDPSPAAEEQWFRRLARITHWRVSYMDGFGSGDSDGGDRILLQIEADAHKRPRTTLYVARYRRKLQRFLGRSMATLAGTLEDAADAYLNNNVWATMINARPPFLVSPKVVKDARIEAIEKWKTTPDAVLAVKPGTAGKVSDLINELKVVEDSKTPEKIEALRREFDFTAGASPAAMGRDQPVTKTFSEVALNESKSDTLLDSVVIDMIKEMLRLIKNLIEDMLWFQDPEEFLDWAARVSGIGRSQIMRLLPSVDGIENEVEITHRLLANIDPAVIVTLLTQIYAMLGDRAQEVFPDVRQFATRLMEIGGYPLGEDLVYSDDVMSPEDEFHRMLQGKSVDPSPQEPIIEHLMEHRQQMLIVKAGGGGLDEEELANASELLPDHVLRTMDMAKALVQLQAGMGQNEEQGSGSAPRGAPENKERKSQTVRNKSKKAPKENAANASA